MQATSKAHAAGYDHLEDMLTRGQALIELRRYREAEDHFGLLTVKYPSEWRIYYLKGLAQLNQADQKPEKAKEGLTSAQRAIGLRPDAASCHFLMALAYLSLRKYVLSLEAAHAGMRLDPEDAWGYSLVARVYLAERNWEKALLAANTGLRLDPENSSLLNCRAEALIMLGRSGEAKAAIQTALTHDPSSPRAHANKGWLALHQNNPQEAILHFRESLRLDPTSDSARVGLLNSLQARNPVYRLVLNYYLWTGRLTRTEFWAAIVMINGFNSLLRSAAGVFPPLLIIVLPYLLLFSLFSFFTWIADSFFNLLLRLSPTGRMVLSKDEKASANGCAFMSALILINATALLAVLFTNAYDFNRLWIFVVGTLVSIGMTVPVSGIFKVNPKHRTPRAILIVIAVLLGSCSVCGWAGTFNLEPWHAIPLVLFLCGWFAYPWIANLVIASAD